MTEAVNQCTGFPVTIKIIPDLYSIVMGQARTNQIYGFPLIEIFPQIMPLWERRFKRLLDITAALAIILLGLPFWLVLALIIKLDSRGPIFYRQARVGRDGRVFTIIKFRTMVQNAEQLTGPKWAEKDDPRITSAGRFMRKWRLDEFPQFINVLRGEMSLVGPRPERPYFVEKLKKEVPFYMRRLKVQPGITGWAQVKGSYDNTIEDVKQKLQYDFFYVENMSLAMDFKILLNTIYVMLAGKGQ
jgi:exopolysaccharide biosynthesis polyprenyl glycosylphosphotransferase